MCMPHCHFKGVFVYFFILFIYTFTFYLDNNIALKYTEEMYYLRATNII